MSRPADGGGKKKPTNPYINPFQHIQNFSAGRIDQGVDTGGQGALTAIGNATITQSATGTEWDAAHGGVDPGGFVEYQLNSGPAVNKRVYMAEGLYPTVSVGQRVKAGEIIAKQTGAIESGWGSNVGYTSLSSQPEGGSIGGAGPFPTKLGINFDQLLVGLGVKPSPGIDQQGSGKLPHGFKKNYGKGKQSGGGGGGGTNAVTTSIFGDLHSLSDFFGLLSSADLWERVGLVLLGVIMIIIGILILVAPSANQKIGEALGIVTKTKRLGREVGIGDSGPSGPSPEVQADRERRIALAERNAEIGERKVSVMESKEGRLSLGKPAAAKKHKSGNPEPNPNPAHS